MHKQASKRFKSGRFQKRFPKLLSLFASLLLIAMFSQGASAAPAVPITRILQVQPIILSNDDGSETARFIGSPGDVTYETVLARTNEVWHQAGIHVILLPAKYWNNTYANVGDPCEYEGHTGTGAPGDPCTGGLRRSNNATFIQAAEVAGVASVGLHSTVMDAYFQRVGHDSPRSGEDTVSGVGHQLNNSQTMYIGEGSWLANPTGLEIIGNVFAHEMGHTLGLAHTEQDPAILSCPPYNIMLGAGCGDEVPRGTALLPSQIAIALTGNLAPVPALAVANKQINNLQGVVKNMAVNKDIKGALLLELEAVKLALKNNKRDKACDVMKVFNSTVTYLLSKGKLTASQGRLLNTASTDIRAAIGCQ